MRKIAAVAVELLLVLFSLPAAAFEDEFASPISRILIDRHFDNDDVIEILVHGNYPNSCYRMGQTGAEVDEETKTIVVWATSFLSADYFCQQSFVPFLQSVKIGVLEGGKYTVTYRDNEEVTATLDVEILSF